MPRSLFLVAGTAFLLMLGLSVLFPVLPFYVRWLDLTEVEAGVLMSIYAGIGVVVSPLWGKFSERFGRKPAIMIGLLGFAGGFGLFGLGSTFGELLAARIVGGLFAAAAIPAIFAYAADVTTTAQRSVAMGMLGAAIGLGIICGPAVGGLLAPLGLRVPFFVSAGVGLVATVLVGLTLEEPERAPVSANTPARPPLRRLVGPLKGFLGYAFLLATGRMGMESTIGFLVEDRFGGGPAAVGGLLAAVGVVGVLVQGGGIRPLVRRYGDRPLVLVGTALVAAGLLLVGVAPTWPALVGGGVVMAMGYGLATPTFTAELSRRGEAFQGEAQGLNNSAQSLGRVAGPLLFTAIYQVYGGAACYGVAAALGLAAVGVAAAGLGAGPSKLET